MGDIIYWKQYDEPRKWFDPIVKKEMESTGQFVCEDERVERAWVTVGMGIFPKDGDLGNGRHDNYDCIICCHLLMKDGERKEFITKSDWDNANEKPSISQAEQYLRNI